MFRIRPIHNNDLDSLLELVKLATFGLSSLPVNKSYLKERIEHSQSLFHTPHPSPEEAAYLFVLEEIGQEGILGCSGIVPKTGGFTPFYTFELLTEHKHSKDLNKRISMRYLKALEEHNGPAEIGSLFLHPEHRKGQLGRLLSWSRFLYIAQHPEDFDKEVIAELRGNITEDGKSPFWNGLGQHFFGMDFPRADYISTINKKVLHDLLPKHPIYVDLLPTEAQNCLQKVHPKTEAAKAMLEQQGFQMKNWVDVFDGGPVYSCLRDDIFVVKNSFCLEAYSKEELKDSYFALISNAKNDFTCIQSHVQVQGQKCYLPSQSIEALHIQEGDTIRIFVQHKE